MSKICLQSGLNPATSIHMDCTALTNGYNCMGSMKPMIQQSNHDAGGDTAARSSGAHAAEQPMSSGQVKNAVDGALRMMERDQAAPVPASTGNPDLNARALEAYVARRKTLAARIRAENPSCTDEEIEARLEQFGA